jgi:hypothetical protein
VSEPPPAPGAQRQLVCRPLPLVIACVAANQSPSQTIMARRPRRHTGNKNFPPSKSSSLHNVLHTTPLPRGTSAFRVIYHVSHPATCVSSPVLAPCPLPPVFCPCLLPPVPCPLSSAPRPSPPAPCPLPSSPCRLPACALLELEESSFSQRTVIIHCPAPVSFYFFLRARQFTRPTAEVITPPLPGL